jgi:hypothetical protein
MTEDGFAFCLYLALKFLYYFYRLSYSSYFNDGPVTVTRSLSGFLPSSLIQHNKELIFIFTAETDDTDGMDDTSASSVRIFLFCFTE